MTLYPGKWYRVEQRGCTPNGVGCLHLDWPLERQDLSPTKTDTRHIAPKSVLRYCLNAQLDGDWRVWRSSARVWNAIGQRKRGGTVFRVTGQTEREALQNLCAEMKVKLP
jgi:hypothetical protein